MSFLRRIADCSGVTLKNHLPLSQTLIEIRVTNEVVASFVENWFASVECDYCFKTELDNSIKVFLNLLKIEAEYIKPFTQDVYSLGYLCFFLERNFNADINKRTIYYQCLKELMDGVSLGLTINSRLFYHKLIQIKYDFEFFSADSLYDLASPYIFGDSFSKREFIKRLQQQAILLQAKKGYYRFVNLRVRRFFRYIGSLDMTYLEEANAVAYREAKFNYYDYLRRSAD